MKWTVNPQNNIEETVWDNFGSISNLGIKFTYDTNNVTTGFLTADGKSQLSITVSAKFLDKNNQPMTGFSGQDLADALSLVYNDDQTPVSQTDESTMATTGNPLAYQWNGEYSIDSGTGVSQILFLVSAPSSQTGINKDIAAMFVQPGTSASPTVSSGHLTICPKADAFEDLGKISNLTISFDAYPTSTSRQIQADGSTQIAVTLSVTCLDASGNPLYQILPDNLPGVLDLIYYDSGTELTWTENPSPDIQGNPLFYTSHAASQTSASKDVDKLPVGNIGGSSDGTCYITYYVSAPASADGTTSQIAAKFSAHGVTSTTQSGSAYDKALTIVAISSAWWNLKDVTKLSISFTDYSSSKDKTIKADGLYQIAVTFSITCTDQDGQPLTGPTNNDLFGPASLIYYDQGNELQWTSSLTSSTPGNPLTYTSTPSSEYNPPQIKRRTTTAGDGQPGTYSATFYVSAPAASDGTKSVIAGKFTVGGQTYTTQAGSAFDCSLTITASAGEWWNLGSLTGLTCLFEDDTDSSQCAIYANGLNQVGVVVDVKCNDTDGLPLTGISNQALLDAISLVYDSDGMPLNSASDRGLGYTTTRNDYAVARFDVSASARKPTVRPSDNAPGEYSVIYYVFNTDPTDTTTITIAAQFEAGSINQTTRSNSGSFAKTLNIAVDPPRTYSASDFQMKYLDGADQGGNIDFQTKTGVFYTVKYYYLCPANSDSDAVLIKSASVRCTAPANGPDYNVMGINDDQMDHLDNAFCFGGNYPGNVHAQAWFLTLNDGTHSDPFWPASNDCIDVSSDQADGPAFYTLHAPTNADYYDAGDSGYWVATVNFYDQYGNTGLVWVCTQNNVTSFFVMDPN